MPRRAEVDPRFGDELRRLRQARGLSLRQLAQLAYVGKSSLSEYENGVKSPTPDTAALLDSVLEADGRLTRMVTEPSQPSAPSDDEEQALELARRVAASDVGTETLAQLESAVDDLATAYPSTPPAEILPRVRRHLGYVARLFELRKTLNEHRRLIVAGSWLSLLAATLHIDLHQRSAAASRLRVAGQLAQHAAHPEISAWCLETAAWDALTQHDYRRAITLSQAAQEVAPAGGSGHIQATAQEGRAWARLGDRRRTYAALERVHELVSPLPMPDRPEHHYRYDPAKAVAYTATTLSWIGDPAAIDHARQVIARLESPFDGPVRPRRAASARLDLALALVGVDELEEAADLVVRAIDSGRLVPSNFWRVEEVVSKLAPHHTAAAKDLRDRYRALVRG